jgi:hypothetical protein
MSRRKNAATAGDDVDQLDQRAKSKEELEAEARQLAGLPPVEDDELIVQRGARQVWHHLFKLSVAKVTKDHGWDPSKPHIIEHEHTHIFHTVDSNGEPQTQTNNVAGHFHSVEVVQNSDPKKRPTIRISEAKKLVRKEVRKGYFKTVVVSYDEYDREMNPLPPHTHDFQYMGSDLISVRHHNPEFVKFQAEQAAKRPDKIAGILGG